MIFSKEMFETIKEKAKTDITEYLTDILYEDKNGWIYLNNDKYTYYIERVNNNMFNIKLEIYAEECDENINIEIDTFLNIFN